MGTQDPASKLRAPREGVIANVSLKHPRTLKPGTACSGGVGGVHEAATGESALWVFVRAPTINGGGATVEGGVSCGGKCGWSYRYSLVQSDKGEWVVTKEEQLSQS